MLMLSMVPCFTLLSIIFLDSTLRDWNVMLDPSAARKPPHEKVGSLKEASATPPTMGISVATTGREGTVPRNSQERSTEKKGSAA